MGPRIGSVAPVQRATLGANTAGRAAVRVRRRRTHHRLRSYGRNPAAARVALDRSDAKITVKQIQLSVCDVHAEWELQPCCILTTKAVHELPRTDRNYGLVSMCCGGGLGTGTLIQRVA